MDQYQGQNIYKCTGGGSQNYIGHIMIKYKPEMCDKDIYAATRKYI